MGNLGVKIDDIKTSLVDIKKEGTSFFTELEDLLSDLKSSKESLYEKIKSIEKEKKELSNDLKKLKISFLLWAFKPKEA